MTKSNISALLEAIETGACDNETIAALEACVCEQGSDGYYEKDVNKYLLKMYQCFPEKLNIDLVVNILVLAIMRLPGKDLLSFQLLIPLSYENNEKVKVVIESIKALESGEFERFWADKNAQESVFSATGFDDAVRSFIFGNVCDTFRTIKVSAFKSMLNLESTANYGSFCHRYRSSILSVRVCCSECVSPFANI